MQVFHHISSLREALAAERRNGKRIGFVPTMGNLHNAHIELVKIAQRNCDVVVTSIFVNPLQFGLNEDWDKYPRTLAADSAKLEAVNCDYLFCPDEKKINLIVSSDRTEVLCRLILIVFFALSGPATLRA